MPLPREDFDAGRRGPLAGVRVLDFSRLVAGNMLSLQLADFGAEVVKVETPGRGDTLRDWREGGVSVHWKVYARNKKSITLNLKAPEAPGIIARPRPRLRRADRELPLRLSRAPRRRRRTRCSRAIRGWSSSACRASARPARTASARASARSSRRCRASPSRNGFADREPVLPPLAMADMIAGLYGAMATVIAVRHVEVNGGRGQVIDLSLLESIFSILGPEAAIHKLSGACGERVGSASETTSPRNVYATKRRRLGRHLRVDPVDDRAPLPRDRPRRPQRGPRVQDQRRAHQAARARSTPSSAASSAQRTLADAMRVLRGRTA